VGISAVAGCLGGSTVANTQEVKLKSDGFDPKNIKVDRQKIVYWENVTDTAYVLVSASDTWDYRQRVDPGKTTAQEFTTSGIYRLVARKRDGENGSEATPTGSPEFTGLRMKIAVGQEMEDPITD